VAASLSGGGEAAQGDRLARTITDRKSKRRERRATLEGADRVLELQGFGCARPALQQARAVDDLRGRQLGIGVTKLPLLSRGQELAVAAVDLQIPAVEILQPDERRTFVEPGAEQRIHHGTGRRLLARCRMDHDQRAPPAKCVDHRLDVDRDALEDKIGVIEPTAQHLLDAHVLLEHFGRRAVSL
jgi:hypothetical protein